VEYQPDGSSNTMWKQYLQNPKGFAFWRKICMQYPQSKKRLVLDCIHYVAESLIAREKAFLKNSPQKAITLLAFPAGVLLWWYLSVRALRSNAYDS
jgi:hypothetical protein